MSNVGSQPRPSTARHACDAFTNLVDIIIPSLEHVAPAILRPLAVEPNKGMGNTELSQPFTKIGQRASLLVEHAPASRARKIRKCEDTQGKPLSLILLVDPRHTAATSSLAHQPVKHGVQVLALAIGLPV